MQNLNAINVPPFTESLASTMLGVKNFTDEYAVGEKFVFGESPL